MVEAAAAVLEKLVEKQTEKFVAKCNITGARM